MEKYIQQVLPGLEVVESSEKGASDEAVSWCINELLEHGNIHKAYMYGDIREAFPPIEDIKKRGRPRRSIFSKLRVGAEVYKKRQGWTLVAATEAVAEGQSFGTRTAKQDHDFFIDWCRKTENAPEEKAERFLQNMSQKKHR